MEITNTPKLTDEVTKALRGQCARRASTICLMLQEAEKEGLSEDHARRAIYKYGEAIGQDIKAQMKDPSDMMEFAGNFAVGLDRNIYEMETMASDENKLYIDFHYCPYVEQWLKMGKTADEINRLCDIAMEGDRAIGDQFTDFRFILGKTIAQGNSVCQLRFERRTP